MNKITLGFFPAKSKTTIKGLLLLFAFLLMITQTSWGQISITGTGSGNTYSQNFNTLASTGTTNAVTTLPVGWSFLETGTGANTNYAAGTGSGTAGDTYSFGATSDTDRALGGLLSGSVVPTLGVSFTNNSGGYISELVITYTGEQWRLGAANRADRLDFQYSLSATSLSTGTWTDVDNLDFIAPVTVTLGLKDGNAVGNKTSMSYTITGLAIASGTTFWLRFNDFNATGADDGLAVDDFSVYANAPTSTTWTTAWSYGAPTASLDAIIASDYSVAANITAKTLTVNNNAIVTIPSGNNVTVTGAVTVTAPATFTLSNNANLIQDSATTTNSNVGAITVNRNSNPLYRLDYTIWSSPVASQNLLAFSPLTNTTRFYSYDNTAGTAGLYSTILTPSSTAFASGAGYLIRMPNEDPSNLGGGSPYSLGSLAITYNGVFTGIPNNGDVPVTLNYVDPLHGYNMVGNPYPSTIDANKFITDNTDNIESTLYFWRKTNGSGTSYAAYNPAGGVLTYPSTTSGTPNGTIQVGQGFLVQAKNAGTIANFFTNAMRLGTSSTQFFKTKQVVEKNRVWLNLTNSSGVFSQTLVGYITDATQGIDIYDGKYINDSKVALTSNINNEEYTIQGRPAFEASDVVALNFKTDVAGDYSIAIDHVDGLFSGSQDIYLVDNANGSETNLKTAVYTFTAAAGVDNARFSLKYQKTLKVDAPSFTDNSVTVYKNKGTLYVNSGSVAIANIKVFDIQGRLIAEQKNVKANSATINHLKATQQVLIVKVTGQDNSVVNKKVVN